MWSSSGKQPPAEGGKLFGEFEATGAEGAPLVIESPTGHQIDLGPLEESVSQMGAMDSVSRQLLLALLRRLIMIINSILGE